MIVPFLRLSNTIIASIERTFASRS